MNFGRISTGGAAGFLASSIGGPVYALSIVFAPGGGDVFELDVNIGPGLVLGLPLTMLFGLVLAGLPGILLGMALGAKIGDEPMQPQLVAMAMIVGAIGGALLLRSLFDVDFNATVAIRGAAIGAVTGYVWTQIFDFLRNRKPTVIADEPA